MRLPPDLLLGILDVDMTADEVEAAEAALARAAKLRFCLDRRRDAPEVIHCDMSLLLCVAVKVLERDEAGERVDNTIGSCCCDCDSRCDF